MDPSMDYMWFREFGMNIIHSIGNTLRSQILKKIPYYLKKLKITKDYLIKLR